MQPVARGDPGISGWMGSLRHLACSLPGDWIIPTPMPAWVGKTSLKGDGRVTSPLILGGHNPIEQTGEGFLNSRSDNHWARRHPSSSVRTLLKDIPHAALSNLNPSTSCNSPLICPPSSVSILLSLPPSLTHSTGHSRALSVGQLLL